MRAEREEQSSEKPRESGQFSLSAWSAFLSGRVVVGAVVAIERGRKIGLRLDWSNGFNAVAVERYQDLFPALEQGMSNLQLASALPAAASSVLRRANLLLQALGVARATLPLIARVLQEVPLPEPGGRWISIELEGPSTWTLAELDVVYLGLVGMDISRIQALRGTSLQTVRAQARSAAMKAGCQDRFEIGAAESLQVSWRLWQGPPLAPSTFKKADGARW